MMLSKGERNKIYATIVGAEEDPAEYRLEDTGEKVTLTHNSGATLEFWLKPPDPNPYLSSVIKLESKFAPDLGAKYEVRFSVPEGVDKTETAISIGYIATALVSEWIHEIQLTVDMPDFWEEMKRRGQLLTEIQHESENAPFTQNEQKQILAQLQEIRGQVKEQFDLTGEQVAQLDEKLDEVAEASTHMGRKDWLIYFLGTITALVITATVTGGVGEHIFTMVVHGLAHLFTGGSEPPQILA